MLFSLEIFVLLCIFGYFIGRNRTSTMIDIITTRFREAYTWIIPPEHEKHQNSSYKRDNQHVASIKRLSDERQKRFSSERDGRNTHITKTIQEAFDEDRSDSPAHGLICQDCSKNLNGKSQLCSTKRALAASDILQVTQHASEGGKYDWGTYFPHLAQNLRLTKFDYKPIFNNVLNHKLMRAEIERVAKSEMRESEMSFEEEEKRYEELLKKYTKRAHKLLLEMRCTLSDNLLRLTSYVLFKLLPWFLSGVVAHPAQIDMIKLAQTKMPNTPLVFLPLHRSHLDYILVTFILLNNDIKCPQVAAGDNLNMPVFGYLLRGLGAFYIKRKIDAADGSKDYIYRRLLQTYLQESISQHHNIEFFIEGGRTRTGKPNMPKSGILSVIVDAFIDGLIDDAILVPVSINYEKLVDGNFVNEQMGTPKKKESFRMAMSSIWKVLNAKYGLMRIDFNEPFSLKELVKSFNERQNAVQIPNPSARKLLSGPSRQSMYGIEVIDKHRVLVDSIARHLVFDSSYATSIMSTNIVAFLLLNKYRNGVTMRELSFALTTLRNQIGADRDLAFEGDSEKVIKRAVELLGIGLVIARVQANGETFIEPVVSVPNVIETAYYSNTFVPHVALDSVTVTSLATLNEGSPMSVNDVVDTAMIYCDILRYEFIFTKPCQDFKEQIEKSLKRLEKFEMLSRNDENVTLNHKSSETLLSAMAPFTLTYFTVAECLAELIDKPNTLEKNFIDTCLKAITKKFDRGTIRYGESISTDSIKNCLKLFEKWVVIEARLNGTIRQISLCPLYNSLDEVQAVIEKIERFVILK